MTRGKRLSNPWLQPVTLVALMVILADAVLLASRSGSDVATAPVPVDSAAAADDVEASAAAPSARAPGLVGRSSAPDVRGVPSSIEENAGLQLPPDVRLVANCDTTTKRIEIPSLNAPPCVPLFTGDNGGATHRGVTSDEITIAVYVPEYNPAGEALFFGIGGKPSDIDPEVEKQAARDYAKFFQAHFQTYGRRIKLVFVEATGPGTDATAAKADAIRVATEVKPFAAIGGPPGAPAYAKELAHRKITCIRCGESFPREMYHRYAPYLWGLFPSQTQAHAHLAEWMADRLHNRPARWAGDAEYQKRKRVFGLVYYDNPDGDYLPAYRYLDTELERRGVTFKTKLTYVADISRAQEQSRTVISKLKADGVTTVVLNTDFAYPIFFTAEATRQSYFPEWVPGFAAILNAFGRAYDPAQWRHAFGLSSLAVRLPRSLDEDVRLFTWHHGFAPPDSSYVYQEMMPLFAGIHLAGPKLTPETFRDGMFAFPTTAGAGAGGLTTTQLSWGRAKAWPATYGDDYSGVDDYAEMWWDPDAQGRDELNHDGVGMFRFVAGGRRYNAGQWPATEPRMFDPDGAVTAYSSIPASDKPPSYQRPKS